MATNPIGGDTAPVTLPGTLPPMPAVARILAGFEPGQLASFVEVAIGLLDVIDPDPAEPDFRPRSDGLPGDPDDTEPNGDDRSDTAWIEWDTRGRHKLCGHGGEAMARNQHGSILHEDAEDCDPAEEDDPAGQCDEDGMNTRGTIVSWALSHARPGCDIADPGGCEHNGMEREQMPGDVPALPTYSAGHNIFNDKRQFLGITNLMSSFVGEVRSAETGRLHRSTWRTDGQPGQPV